MSCLAKWRQRRRDREPLVRRVEGERAPEDARAFHLHGVFGGRAPRTELRHRLPARQVSPAGFGRVDACARSRTASTSSSSAALTDPSPATAARSIQAAAERASCRARPVRDVLATVECRRRHRCAHARDEPLEPDRALRRYGVRHRFRLRPGSQGHHPDLTPEEEADPWVGERRRRPRPRVPRRPRAHRRAHRHVCGITTASSTRLPSGRVTGVQSVSGCGRRARRAPGRTPAASVAVGLAATARLPTSRVRRRRHVCLAFVRLLLDADPGSPSKSPPSASSPSWPGSATRRIGRRLLRAARLRRTGGWHRTPAARHVVGHAEGPPDPRIQRARREGNVDLVTSKRIPGSARSPTRAGRHLVLGRHRQAGRAERGARRDRPPTASSALLGRLPRLGLPPPRSCSPVLLLLGLFTRPAAHRHRAAHAGFIVGISSVCGSAGTRSTAAASLGRRRHQQTHLALHQRAAARLCSPAWPCG